jgi:hypothetical protein
MKLGTYPFTRLLARLNCSALPVKASYSFSPHSHNPHHINPPCALHAPPPTPAYANIPQSLAAVNFCLFIVGAVQCSRILAYNRELTGSTGGAFGRIWGEISGQAKKVEGDAKKEVRELEGKIGA